MVDAKAAERFMASPLLADVEPVLRRAMLEVMAEDRARAGSVLLEQGQPNDHLSFVIEGTVTVERKFPVGTNEVLTTMTAPAVFGTTSFFRPTPPTVNVCALTDVWLLTLYHPAHESLRRENPRAAEALALAVVRVLAERFDILDQRLSEYLRRHNDDQPKPTEWANFRARLFEDSTL
jgi:CRP/FNR family cyclic AMP-dependent transcriptional regulator